MGAMLLSTVQMSGSIEVRETRIEHTEYITLIQQNIKHYVTSTRGVTQEIMNIIPKHDGLAWQLIIRCVTKLI